MASKTGSTPNNRGSTLVSAFVFTLGLITFTQTAFAQDEQAAPVETTSPITENSGEAASTEPAPEQVDESAFATPEAQPTPVPNSRALEESGLSNPRGLGDFKRPLLFAPEDNGLKLENPQLKWTMNPSGSSINIGGLKLDASMIEMQLDQTKREATREDLQNGSEEGRGAWVTNLSFTWPTLLTTSGTISLETSGGKSVWRTRITNEQIAEWRKRLSERQKNELAVHTKSRWGKLDIRKKSIPALFQGGTFRMCITKQNSKIEGMKACTSLMRVTAEGERLSITKVASNDEPNVYIGSKPAGLSALLNFPPGRDIRLKIVFNTGASIQVASQPAKLEVLDAVSSQDGREIILTGRGFQPLGKKKIISKPETHFWSVTGIQQDTIWQIPISVEAPTLRVLGAFNIPFTFIFNYERLPVESDRVFIRERGTTGTYSSHPHIEGFAPGGKKVTSTELFAENTENKRFEWSFAAPKSGDQNRARISLLDPKTKRRWIAHHSIYRGYPFEASARLTGVVTTSGSMVVLGEVAGSAWFENIGFNHEYLSRQRWGTTARYFRALTAIDLGAGQSITDFSVLNADLKYNMVRGVWNRDELFGLIGSAQSLSLAGIQANLAGVGGYWARTMPKVFAEIFDLFPYMDYSKYVDMEFIVYPLSLSSNVQAGSSFNLNFHGKVFWTERIYGEAGFGLKRFDFADRSKNASVSFSTAFGTIGLGMIF